MDKIRYLIHDLAEATAYLKTEIGENLYAPLGIQSNAAVNGFTLYFFLGCVVYLVLRPRPAASRQHAFLRR